MNGVASSLPVSLERPERRHDLDALRAFAMVLGIALHVSLSLFPVPWPVQDSQQSGLLGLVFLGIHGFRMPLFFLLSGYFTQMLFARRGLPALLRQRTVRIFVPCVLGVVTIVPTLRITMDWAMRSVARNSTQASDRSPLVAAIVAGDRDAVRARIAQGDNLHAPSSPLGMTPLSWACMAGNIDAVQMLLDAGADVHQAKRDGNTPLHAAALMGHAEIVQILLEHGADPQAVNRDGATPLRLTHMPYDMARGILLLAGLPIVPESELSAGHDRVRAILKSRDHSEPVVATRNAGHGSVLDRVMHAYTGLVRSNLFRVRVGNWSFHLVTTSVFDHLWFLWFLCWLVAGFAVAVRLGIVSAAGNSIDRFRGWLIPATMLPQLLMGADFPVIGPDTSTGIVPPPHLLVYYGLFFAYGTLMFAAESNGRGARANRIWLVGLAVVILLPLALVTLGQRAASSIVQPLYTWTMCFGMIGLFRRFLSHPRPAIRYLSDASYWMYLVHLPLVVALQVAVRTWPWNPWIKFLGVTALATLVLLVSYQLLVRRTWLGVLLNGTRRSTKAALACLLVVTTFRASYSLEPVDSPAGQADCNSTRSHGSV